MKIVLIVLSGVAMSVVAFAGGILTAVFFLAAEPQKEHPLSVDASGLWTTAPVPVGNQTAGVERTPARPSPSTGVVAPAQAAPMAVGKAESETAGVDATVTGAIEAGAQEAQGPAAVAAAARHVAWCSQRYRSYRAADNSYRPYRGGRQPCISPYLAEATASGVAETSGFEGDQAGIEPEGAALVSAEYGSTGYLTDEHVQSCFSRYRSYRPEDNTYQPYSGGPRRQCE